MSTVKVVKIGGNVLDNPSVLRPFLKAFAQLPGQKILVHGGGKTASAMQKQLGLKPRMINGRRVTDGTTLEIVTSVYAGTISKSLVAMLQALGCNAIGLSGCDGNVITATMRSPEPVDYGFVGDVDPAHINTGFIKLLLDAGVTPVFNAINHNGQGLLLNTNADTIASSVAIAMATVSPTELITCFELPGVLADRNDPTSVIPEITPQSFASLKARGIVADGMIPKIENALQAVANGVKSVIIKEALQLSDFGAGTRVCNA